MLKNCPHCGKQIKAGSATDLDEAILRDFNEHNKGRAFTVSMLANRIASNEDVLPSQVHRGRATAILRRSLKSVFSFGRLAKTACGNYQILPLEP